MDQQDNQEPNNQQALIEDLAINDAQAEEVKGGAGVKTIRFKAGKDLPA